MKLLAPTLSAMTYVMADDESCRKEDPWSNMALEYLKFMTVVETP